MANLIKCPTPRNFRTGKITLSHDEVIDINNGVYDKLVIMKFGGNNEVLFTKNITEAMVETIVDKGEYNLMTYR
jgi:hypothetical protein